MRSLPTPPKGQFRKVNGRPRSRLENSIGSDIPSKGTLLVVDSHIDADRDRLQLPTPEPACAGEVDEEDIDATLSGEEDTETLPAAEVDEEIAFGTEPPALAIRKSVETNSKIDGLSGSTTPTEPKRRLSQDRIEDSWDADEGGRGPRVSIETKQTGHHLASPADIQNFIESKPHEQSPERLAQDLDDSKSVQDTVRQPDSSVEALPPEPESSNRSCQDLAPSPPRGTADEASNPTKMGEKDIAVCNHDTEDENSVHRDRGELEPEPDQLQLPAQPEPGDPSECNETTSPAQTGDESAEKPATQSANVQQESNLHTKETSEQVANGDAAAQNTAFLETESCDEPTAKDGDSNSEGEELKAVLPTEESIDEMLPPRPKPCDVRADIVTFSTRLQMAKRDEESLRGVMLGDKEAASIVHGLRKNSTITSLDLSDSSITPAAASVLASILGTDSVPVPKLTKLVLARCPLGDMAAESLWACLHRLPLDTLDMRSSLLSPVSGETLAASLLRAPLPSLRALNLGGNSLLSTGVAALAPALPLLSSLQTLFLDGNGIDDNGAEALAKALAASPSLLALHLPNNEVTAAGAHALVAAYRARKGVRMRVLDLARNKVSGDSLASLEKTGRPALRLDGRELVRQGSQGSFRVR